MAPSGRVFLSFHLLLCRGFSVITIKAGKYECTEFVGHKPGLLTTTSLILVQLSASIANLIPAHHCLQCSFILKNIGLQSEATFCFLSGCYVFARHSLQETTYYKHE
ncbi:unnamed protein product [Eretmochelys imbricata]